MRRPYLTVPVFLVAFATAITTRYVPMPQGGAIFVALLGAAIAAALTLRIDSARNSPAPGGRIAEQPSDNRATTAYMTPPGATGDNSATISPKLRHDLRGLISPAVLSADQLSSHEDPEVRRRAEQVLDALDRTTALIKAAR
ncbi:hypothetical protein [Acetobacter sp. DsW_063]|uniref:hypothetical protein n=1 Tax=Acetobacter sp. DsW_063 TaxID=1514894 RepID=UPI000A3BE5A4|nr:hypothetical protein [Acetobacter sp. DsW_063]OUJ11740.1 hypothetical protein HK28_04230 [Acetobacter sp. DsW_063]